MTRPLIGVRLAAAILDRGISRSEAARQLGTTPSTLSRWIRSAVTPGADNLARIAAFLDEPEPDVASDAHGERRAQALGRRAVPLVEGVIEAIEEKSRTSDEDRLARLEAKMDQLIEQLSALMEAAQTGKPLRGPLRRRPSE